MQLDEEHPFVELPGKSTKNSDFAKQYIGPELLPALRDQVDDLLPNDFVFDVPLDAAGALRGDLAAGRKAWIDDADDEEQERQRQASFVLAYEDHDGKRLDFHALRHTFGAWLARAGVYPKVVQSMMRHASLDMTFETYGHLWDGAQAEAIVHVRAGAPWS